MDQIEERDRDRHEVSRENLMRYLDGELPPDERRRVEEMLAGSTELQRELAVYRSLHEDLSDLRFRPGNGNRTPSVWGSVQRRLTRPTGWILLGLGTSAWAVHVVYLYFTSPAAPLEKMATSAIGIGILILFATVIQDRIREWRTDPYRDVER